MSDRIEASLAFIQSRRSVFPKEFEDEHVGRDEIASLLEAARWAPTHKLTEPWRFLVFTGNAKDNLRDVQIRALRNRTPEGSETEEKTRKFQMIADRSSAIVAVVMKRDPLARLPVDDEAWAVACAVQNVHLHAAAHRIGMYWSTGASKGAPEVTDMMELDPDDLHMGWLYMGRYTKAKQLVKERKQVGDYVKWMH
jgi:nitroreductase